MKMQRGEMVGYNGCLGYDYHPADKTLTINEKEAEIVRYIFKRYVEGAGSQVIARELREMGVPTKSGMAFNKINDKIYKNVKEHCHVRVAITL